MFPSLAEFSFTQDFACGYPETLTAEMDTALQSGITISTTSNQIGFDQNLLDFTAIGAHVITVKSTVQ